VKFRADSNGFVTGLRFYKGPQNTGSHVGHLWTSTGTLLASVTFTGESASGWQQVTLPTPVAVTANTTSRTAGAWHGVPFRVLAPHLGRSDLGTLGSRGVNRWAIKSITHAR
jgi:hypothetical protein